MPQIENGIEQTRLLSTRDGNAYIVSSGQVSVALLSYAKFTMVNPADSGKNMCIYATAIGTSLAVMSFASLWIGPTTSLPTTVLTPMNQHFGSTNTSIGVIKGDTAVTGISGGTKVMDISVPGGIRNVYEQELLILPPGKTLGLNMQMTVAGTVLARIYYWEEVTS